MGWIGLVIVLICLAYIVGAVNGRMVRFKKFVKLLRETVIETDRFFGVKDPDEGEKDTFTARWYSVIEASGSLLQEVCGRRKEQK